jgi:cyclopropane-fatty-acyl-phospholipid synthase
MKSATLPLFRASPDARMLRALLRSMGRPPVRIELPSGESISECDSSPLATMRFHSRWGLWKFIADPEMQFGELYSSGELVIDGDLLALLTAVFRQLGRARSTLGPAGKLARWVHRASANTLDRALSNVHHHYDIGNSFYRLWLDESMSYTCAYFESPTVTLAEAQSAKMHHVCRKLNLRAGESVVEAGCGWGSLALLMAREYGVKVRAFNISMEQIDYAREEAKRQDLQHLVEFVQDDYRNIVGRYDAFVSVGMLEHVGVAHYAELGSLIARSLNRAGRGLIHTIGRNAPQAINRWIVKRIFPGAEVPSLGQMMRLFEPFDFSILDVENLRLHYALTLEHWLAGFERSAESMRAQFDACFVRMWRLYLASSCAAFRAGDMQLFQVLFAPGRSNDIALTRAHLYRT